MRPPAPRVIERDEHADDDEAQRDDKPSLARAFGHGRGPIRLVAVGEQQPRDEIDRHAEAGDRGEHAQNAYE